MKKLIFSALIALSASTAFAQDFNFFRSDAKISVRDNNVIVYNENNDVVSKSTIDVSGVPHVCKKDVSTPTSITLVFDTAENVRKGTFKETGSLITVFKDGSVEKNDFNSVKCNII